MPKDYKIVVVEERMFGDNLNIFVGSYNDFSKYLKETYSLDIENQGNSAEHIELDNGENRFSFIWLKEYKNTASFQSTLVHELLHYTFAVMKRHGVEYSRDSEETFTYYIDYMYFEAITKLKESFKRIRKEAEKKNKK